MDLFEHLKNITQEKQVLDFNNDSNKKGYEPFIIDRYVSMCDLYLDVALEASKLRVPKETHQRFYISALPKKYVYFNYIKKPKEHLSSEDIDKLYDYFKCGTNDFNDILNCLEDSTIEEIIRKYDSGLVKKSKKQDVENELFE
jgi:hypothetical protein